MPASRFHWSAIEVPGDRNRLKPDERLAHRFFYRTRVKVPASMEDRSFFLSCEEASMLTTVFVNGERVGFSDAALAPFRFDLTEALEPGEINEIRVGIKDAYYAPGGEAKDGNTTLARSQFNMPLSRTRSQGFTLQFEYPVAGYMRTGMMGAVRLVAAGGDLMLWNLAPDGLERFNELVGQEHLIRPFTREKVTVRLPRHPLATGLSQRSLRMTAGTLGAHQRVEWVTDDIFTHVLSLDSLVPFLEGPGIEPDHNGGSIANGFTDKEFWRYVHYIAFEPEKGPPSYHYTLPRTETITSFSLVPNSHYHRVRTIRLTFHQEGGGETVREIELAPYTRPDNPRQDFELRVEDVNAFTMDFLEWDEGTRSILGIDNLWIGVERPPEFDEEVQPLPIGRQTFAGVQYEIRDFLTSPLEHGIGLGERAGLPERVSGIEVKRKADSFFFLHAMIGRKIADWFAKPGWQAKDPNPPIFHYRVHYADGESVNVAVNAGEDIHLLDRSGEPLDMKNAKVAWSVPFAEGGETRATLYAMQWDNPRPDVAVDRIDIVLDEDKKDWWGHPLVLAITAAEVIE